jgi:spore coat polysaccharide biosynthesis protein SpsF (cytidylyltransferase family)
VPDKQKVIAIIQARMGASRLPGKVLAEIVGRPMLWHVVERTRQAQSVDGVIVATSDEAPDDAITSFCASAGIEHFRGSEADVLDRYYQAARKVGADVVVRITADCPLIDGGVVDGVVELFARAGADYASNVNPPTFPDGLDVEVFSFAALETTWKEASKKYQREHTTSYITENPDAFRLANLTHPRDLSGWRLTVDEAEDLQLVRRVFEALYDADRLFSFEQVVAYLDRHPDLLEINSQFARNEGYNTEDV